MVGLALPRLVFPPEAEVDSGRSTAVVGLNKIKLDRVSVCCSTIRQIISRRHTEGRSPSLRLRAEKQQPLGHSRYAGGLSDEEVMSEWSEIYEYREKEKELLNCSTRASISDKSLGDGAAPAPTAKLGRMTISRSDRAPGAVEIGNSRHGRGGKGRG